MNDSISKGLANLSYITVEDVVVGIIQRGRGTLLAKMDIRQAYRNVLIHPSDKPACNGKGIHLRMQHYLLI